MASYNKKNIGQEAEKAACHFLESRGLRLMARNYRCFHGEIDLIMQDKDVIVFVEVRKRHRIDYGNALDSINNNKKRKLIKTATHYLQKEHCLYKVHSRFDVIAIHPVEGNMQLQWIKNAFTAS